MKRKVLIADDSNTVLLMHRMCFPVTEFDLVMARNGREAVEKAHTEGPDIIFLDVLMPELDGFSACRLLKASPQTRGIPVVMVTTRGEPHNIQAGYDAGCSDYVTKPFDRVDLMSKLHHLLGA